eukprot:5628512-Pleurochrysis_carterae.AAC.8
MAVSPAAKTAPTMRRGGARPVMLDLILVCHAKLDLLLVCHSHTRPLTCGAPFRLPTRPSVSLDPL